MYKSSDSITFKEVEYTPELWRKLGVLAKKLEKKSNTGESHKTFGSSNKQATTFARRLCRLLGVNATHFDIYHPKNGHLRSVCYTLAGYQDSSAGIYIDD